MANRRVEVEYRAVDSASPTIRRLQQANSGLLQSMGGGFSGLIGNIANFGLALQTVRMIAGGAFDLIKKGVLETNQSFVQANLNIASNLQAFDMAKDWGDAQKQAEGIYGVLRKIAAPLPGTTAEYLRVFQTVLPQAIESFAAQGKTSLTEMAEFTAKWSAISIASGIDAAQAARDMRQMLSGRAGLDVRSFSELMGHLKRSAKDLGMQAELTTEAFNKMGAGDRLKIMQRVIERFPIDKFGGTAEAMTGALQTVTEDFLRIATGGLFDSYLGAMKDISMWLGEHEAQLLRVSTAIGETLGAAAQGIVDAAKRIGRMIADNPYFRQALDRGLAMGSEVSFGGSSVASESAAVFGSGRVAVALMDAAQPFVDALTALASAAADNAPAVTAFLGVLELAVRGASVAAYALYPSWIVLQGIADGLSRAFPTVLDEFLKLTNTTLRLANSILTFQTSSKTLSFAISTVIQSFGWLDSMLADLAIGLNLLLTKLGGWLGIDLSGDKTRGSMGPFLADTEAGMKLNPALGYGYGNLSGMPAFGTAKNAGIAGLLGAPKKRSSTTFDFRNSRFDITQSFAEGFDPDRIAAVFANDLAKLGEMRTQSGLAPLAAVR